MRFLRNSPFAHPFDDTMEEVLAGMKESDWEPFFEVLDKQLDAIGVTNNGKHVILQQAVRSCIPTCVAMLALDHGKTPNYDAITKTDLASHGDQLQWMKEAGLEPIDSRFENKEQFINLITQHGSGILEIGHRTIGGHVIIVDAISEGRGTAEIRDPFHGWALTIKLDDLLSWSPTTFTQVKSS